MTASMVKLGLLGTVHDIVVSLCNQDRADAVAAVTASLLAQGEVVVVTRITNALVASGHSEQAATISGTAFIFVLLTNSGSCAEGYMVLHRPTDTLGMGRWQESLKPWPKCFTNQEAAALKCRIDWGMYVGELISQGNTQIYEVVKEAGLNMGLLSGESSSKNSQATDGRAGTSGNEVIEGIKEQGAQVP